MPTPPAARHWFDLPYAPAPGTTVGARDTFADGQATLLALDTGAGVDHPFRLLLLRSGLAVHAFVNRCAHFGVPLAARQEQLIQTPHASITCNVHYARYRWSDGVCEWGDCEGESLIPVPLDVGADGHIRIGTAVRPLP